MPFRARIACHGVIKGYKAKERFMIESRCHLPVGQVQQSDFESLDLGTWSKVHLGAQKNPHRKAMFLFHKHRLGVKGVLQL